jgi:hypothetical protein
MKHYLLIAGDQYYPFSGTGDWKGCYETYEEAKEEVIAVTVAKYQSKRFGDEVISKYSIRGADYDWYEIVDLRDWMRND